MAQAGALAEHLGQPVQVVDCGSGVDLPTLDLLGSYRRHVATTEPLPFGIYGEVLHEARVSVGDPVERVD